MKDEATVQLQAVHPFGISLHLGPASVPSIAEQLDNEIGVRVVAVDSNQSAVDAAQMSLHLRTWEASSSGELQVTTLQP